MLELLHGNLLNLKKKIFFRLCSTFFHSVDFTLSEYLDYFSASGVLIVSLYAAISFVFPNLQQNSNSRLM